MTKKSTPQNRHDLQAWVETWRKAAPVLETERGRHFDTRQFLRVSTGLLDAFYKDNPMPQTSGLVEQQKLFRTRT
jgi:hypothetical protein